MTLLLPIVLGGLFALLSPLVVAYVLLRAAFLLRPPSPDARKSFHRTSIVGSLALIPPMFFVGVLLFSAMNSGMPQDIAQPGVAEQRILGSLVLLGILAQLLRGQRLTLLAGSGSGIASVQRLVVERVVTGTSQDLARGDISSIDLYRRWYNYRHRKIQLHLKDGKTIRLLFGEEIRAELTTWLDESQS